MDELSTLQSRANALLAIPITQPPAQATAAISPQIAMEKVVAPPRQRFSPFISAQMQRATELAEHFMTLADSKEGTEGMTAVLDEADEAAATENPELVRYALMLFMTHHPKGNQLKLKPLEKRAPQLVLPSRPTAVLAEVPLEASLNWFREDPKANEHHEHWHLVYPSHGIQGLTKDRQGELFLYMHEQMIARYDAERLAMGLEPVKPFPLNDYHEQIPEGYDPDPHLRDGDIPFSSRPPGERLGDLPGLSVATLKQRGEKLLNAVQDGTFQDANQLGATVEASIDSIGQTTYGSYHNAGHNFLAEINAPQDPNTVPGVMTDPTTAIRDPIFFRWHKHVDEISFQWQERQNPHDFSDAPQVLLRKGLNGTTPDHQSPDIILCFKDKILSPGSDDSDDSWQSYGEKNFGDANWDKDFSSSNTTTGELQTTMRQRQITISSPEGDDQPELISYLFPREFFYFLRVENLTNQAKEVSVRIFLTPTGSYAGIPEIAEDRRKWIEMDRFTYTLQPQPSQRTVIFRRADASSVIRKPALKTFDPAEIDVDGDSYCDCGWPYNLLLPGGTSQGMKFRLLVMITDYEKDRVLDEIAPDDTACEGSMSYCGA